MAKWNKGVLDSFLIEITSEILKYKDEKGESLVEKIRDAAGQVSQTYCDCAATVFSGVVIELCFSMFL